MQNTLLRLPEVRLRRALSRSTLYAHVDCGLLTPPIKISARAVAWPSMEIEAINAAQIAGKTDAEIKALVIELVAARKAVA